MSGDGAAATGGSDALRYTVEGVRHGTYDASMRWIGTQG